MGRQKSGVCPDCGQYIKHLWAHRNAKYPCTDPQFTEEELEAFEDQSFKNVVDFNRERLLQVHNGSNSAEVFNYSERRSLIKNGVLKAFFGVKSIKLRKSILTQKAQALL